MCTKYTVRFRPCERVQFNWALSHGRKSSKNLDLKSETILLHLQHVLIVNPRLIEDLWIMPLRLKTSEMAKEQERRVEPQGIEPRATGIPCHCSATMLQLPPATTPHSCPLCSFL